jgi:hypothetical protein
MLRLPGHQVKVLASLSLHNDNRVTQTQLQARIAP